MRSTGLVLLVVGLVALAGGLFMGCGSLFAWNGRHAIAVAPITLGTPSETKLPVRGGRTYSLAVQVVFDREGLPEENGVLVIDARLPIAASIRGATGDAREISGVLDPREPPTTLFGQAADLERKRPPPGATLPELAAQRLVGPFRPAEDGEASFAVALGADAVGTARIREVRAVVYDDAMPAAVRLPLTVAAAGGLATAGGLGIVAIGFFRKRSGRRPRKNV